MENNKTYQVGEQGFDKFSEAVTCAKAAGLTVTLTADGRRVWSPAAKKPAPRTVHVILNADGTETPFSKVKR